MRRAFTLIELLVVIAILGLLAAILFPVFGRVRENGRRTSCQSNLKQVGAGLLLYTQDYDEALTRSFYGSFGDSDPLVNYKWMDAIYPYVKSEGLFNCPSDSATNRYRYRDGLNYGSYGLNGAYSALTDNQTPPRSGNGLLVTMAQLAVPSTTVWVTDNNNAPSAANTGGSQGFFWATSPPSPLITNTNPRQLQNIVERHLDTTGVLFCDGHVKPLKLEALAANKQLVDPVDGQTKNVLTLLTIEDD